MDMAFVDSTLTLPDTPELGSFFMRNHERWQTEFSLGFAGDTTVPPHQAFIKSDEGSTFSAFIQTEYSVWLLHDWTLTIYVADRYTADFLRAHVKRLLLYHRSHPNPRPHQFGLPEIMSALQRIPPHFKSAYRHLTALVSDVVDYEIRTRLPSCQQTSSAFLFYKECLRLYWRMDLPLMLRQMWVTFSAPSWPFAPDAWFCGPGRLVDVALTDMEQEMVVTVNYTGPKQESMLLLFKSHKPFEGYGFIRSWEWVPDDNSSWSVHLSICDGEATDEA